MSSFQHLPALSSIKLSCFSVFWFPQTQSGDNCVYLTGVLGGLCELMFEKSLERGASHDGLNGIFKMGIT